MATKFCCRCSVLKQLELFVKDKRGTGGRSTLCKACANIRASTAYASNVNGRRDKARAASREQNRIAVARRGGSWGSEARKKWVREYERRRRAELHDCYVRQELARRTVLSRADIPDEMVGAKRLVLAIKRHIKESSK
jgi:hypothetical protein